MKFLGTEIAPLGMGTWPIGGPFFDGDTPLGYANNEDGESIRALHAALDHGITLFDTAAVYGAGHAERLLGKAFAGRDAMIVTKIGIGFDEVTKQVQFGQTDPAKVMPAIDRCLARLQRNCVDMVLLHNNSLAVDEAAPIFDVMDRAIEAGKIRSYGWSTDYPASVSAMAGRDGFGAVQHAMNLFVDVPTIQGVAHEADLVTMLRSPLAMGVLSGKFTDATVLPKGDIRATKTDWEAYFMGGKVAPGYLDQLAALRELLQSGGRTLPQGALCWLMAKSPLNLPIPGARTVAQITDNAGAISHGPLPDAVMQEIERVIERAPEGPPRDR